MNKSSSKHSKSSEEESSEPVAWVAAIVINAALVILFLSVVIYCYCKNKTKHEESRRQKLKNQRIIAERNWKRISMKPSIISHDQPAEYSNVFSVEEQKYHDSLEDLPTTILPRSNILPCSCSQHNRRDQQVKRNNWIPTEIKERPNVKDNQFSKTNKASREGIAWVDVNDKENEKTRYLVYVADEMRSSVEHVGFVVIPKDPSITLSDLRTYLEEGASNVRNIVSKQYHFLSESFKDMTPHEQYTTVKEIYPSQGIILKVAKSENTDNFQNRGGPTVIKESKPKKRAANFGRKCYYQECDEAAKYKCRDCGRVSYCSMKCMRKDRSFHQQYCYRPPWRI